MTIVQLDALDANLADLVYALDVEDLRQHWSPTREPADLLDLLALVCEEVEPEISFGLDGVWRIKCSAASVVFAPRDEFAIGICRSVERALSAKGNKS